jgi:hypothetical protein
MGREAGAGPGLLRAELPRAADVLLRSDGSVILARSDVTSVTHPIEAAGAYRLEARRGGRLWLLSNPIYLREAASCAER